MSASLRETGSRPSGHAASGVDGGSRFDPARIVDRVAWALFDAEWQGHGSEAEFGDSLVYWRKSARCAVAAMRAPTEAMIEASNREWDGRLSHRSSGAWQAMIDAALSEGMGG